MTIKFDAANPLNSIETFSMNQAYLDEKNKQEFTQEAREFFVEKGYFDESVELPSNGLERFYKILPIFLGACDLPPVEKLRLLATIEKVTQRHFSLSNPEYNVLSKEKEGCWRWNAQGIIDHETYAKQFFPAIAHRELSRQETPSRWFNPDKPHDSLCRFASRYSLLNHPEQKAMVKTIVQFCISKVLTDQNVKQPGEINRAKLQEVEKLILGLEAGELERDRFSAAFKKIFDCGGDQLCLTSGFYQGRNIHGWLRKEFVQEQHQETLTLEGLTPQLALALQLFQYSPLNLEPLEVAGKIKSAMELWSFARTNELTKLQYQVGDFLLKEHSHSRAKFDAAIASMLPNEDVLVFLGLMKVKELTPESGSDDALFQALTFNMSNLQGDLDEETFKRFACSCNLRVLTLYLNHIRDEKLRLSFMNHLNSYAWNHLKYFPSSNAPIIIGMIVDTLYSNGDFNYQLDCNFTSGDQEALLEFFTTPKIVQFFKDIGQMEKLEAFKQSITTIPATHKLRDAFSNWYQNKEGQFVTCLNEEIECVNSRYQDPLHKTEKLLCHFEESAYPRHLPKLCKAFFKNSDRVTNWILESYKAPKNMTFHIDSSDFLARNFTVSRDALIRIRNLLDSHELREFFKDKVGLQLKQCLDFMLLENEVQHSLKSLLKKLENGEKLEETCNLLNQDKSDLKHSDRLIALHRLLKADNLIVTLPPTTLIQCDPIGKVKIDDLRSVGFCSEFIKPNEFSLDFRVWFKDAASAILKQEAYPQPKVTVKEAKSLKTALTSSEGIKILSKWKATSVKDELFPILESFIKKESSWW